MIEESSKTLWVFGLYLWKDFEFCYRKGENLIYGKKEDKTAGI